MSEPIQTVDVRDLHRDPQAYWNRRIRIGGWIRTLRDQKQFAFISLNDGTWFEPLQVVITREGLADYETVCRYGTGAAIFASGTLIATPQGKQPMELQADTIELEGDSPADYPLQPKRHSAEFLRTIAHLRPRTNLMSAAFRVRSVAAQAIHAFFHDRGFVYVNTPIITGNDCEGAGEMFAVTTIDPAQPPRLEDGAIDYSQDFFGKPTMLSVSGQLNGEAFALAFKKIYTFGPTFRAEESNTFRHAAEFWMIEPEIAFADLNDNMTLCEDLIKHVLAVVLKECAPEIDFCNRFVDPGLAARLESVLDADFARVSYGEAISLLQQADRTFTFPVDWGYALQTEHERYLSEVVYRKPVFVTDYPKEIKAFYMRLNDDGRTVAAMDCLVPGLGEIVGGSQREERSEILLERLRECGLPADDYEWYLQLRRYGSARHAGFGIGFERLLMYLTGIGNIRDVIPFPRTPGNAEF